VRTAFVSCRRLDGVLSARAEANESLSYGGTALRVSRKGKVQETMIQLKNRERKLQNPRRTNWVVCRINMEVREDEFTTRMGPSGAGRSSLLNVLALLDETVGRANTGFASKRSRR
jgi:ABC-type transport system involved in cytochrome bd biosynthesis fused ATPase/permease subunit